MNKLIVANWKMDPKTSEEAKILAMAEDRENVVICPPAVFLDQIVLQQAKLGAQDFEIPVSELKELGVEYVILGHSQRRQNFGETDSMVNVKVIDAIKLGMTPILCLGENVDEQFVNCTKGVGSVDLQKIIYVYEPLNAISTVKDSKPVEPDKANEMIEHIHNLVGENSSVLYGGTVNEDNVRDYAKYPGIGGALVGAASLDAENFSQVILEFNKESTP